MKIPFFLLLIFSLVACKGEIDYSNLQEDDIENEDFDSSQMEIYDNSDVERYHSITGSYPDGTYCAEVEYYNPDTGTRNTYDLNVDVEDGELTVIHWPNGGWLDDTHFSPEDISDGEISFSSDRGYQYVVTLGEYGGNCYSGGQQLVDDINDDIEETTCPNCGDEKYQYDDLCSSCEEEKEREEESICPKCGSYKSSFSEYCHRCENEVDNEE